MKPPRRARTKTAIALGVIALSVGLAWWAYGCVADPPPNLSRLVPAFAAARAEFKDLAAQAVTAGKAKDWGTAVRALGTIIDQGGYSDPQKKELLFALTEIRRKAARVSPPDPPLLYRIDELTLAVTD